MRNNLKKANSYDLNSLLRIANILIPVFATYLYFTSGNNDYVNSLTLLISYFLAVENIGFLFYEQRKRNPFILIFIFVVTLFYMTRIPTLICRPSSAIFFKESSNTAFNLNYSLIFIFFANISMFLGFYLGKTHNMRQHNNNIPESQNSIPRINNAIIIIILVILVGFFDIFDPEIFGRLSGFISEIFFNRHIIILFTFTMLVYHYEKISHHIRFLFLIIFFCLGILITISGSRSGLLLMVTLLLVSSLAVKKKVMIRKKLLMLLLILIPLSFVFFITATFKRQLGIKDKITIEHVVTAKTEEIFDWQRLEYYLDELFFRISYLDFSAEIIANREKYSKILNINYYSESFIDNILTPGFDIFDTPRVAHALSYIRTGRPLPSKNEIKENYQSDQMGIYGEFYVLFYGFAGLPVFFFLAFIMQKVLNIFTITNSFSACLCRAIILYLFYNLLNSFGIDWFIMDLIATIITTFLFARFYVVKRKKAKFRQNNDECIRLSNP